MNQHTKQNLVKIIILVCVLLGVWGIYIVISSVIVSKNTILLTVKTTSPSSAISISALNQSATLLGVGTTSNRIKPGKYLITANLSGKSVSKVVDAVIGNNQIISLDPKKPNILPSIYNISYIDSNYILKQGFTNGQLGLIEKSLYSFAPNSKNIEFINNSASYAPYDPNTSTSFTMYFKINIDGASYSTSINYSGLTSLDLVLYNSSSTKVFDSGVVSF
jgi:hypothetical protein